MATATVNQLRLSTDASVSASSSGGTRTARSTRRRSRCRTRRGRTRRPGRPSCRSRPPAPPRPAAMRAELVTPPATRAKTSRPNWSVPNQCSHRRPEQRFGGSCAPGRRAAARSTSSSTSVTGIVMSTRPIRPLGLRSNARGRRPAAAGVRGGDLVRLQPAETAGRQLDHAPPRGSITRYSPSVARLTITNAVAMTSTVLCTTAYSFCWMPSSTWRPMPGTEKICSTTTAPPSR